MVPRVALPLALPPLDQPGQLAPLLLLLELAVSLLAARLQGERLQLPLLHRQHVEHLAPESSR